MVQPPNRRAQVIDSRVFDFRPKRLSEARIFLRSSFVMPSHFGVTHSRVISAAGVFTMRFASQEFRNIARR